MFVLIYNLGFKNIQQTVWYEFFSDPIWQFLGAYIGAVGVFIGAWYGAKLGLKSAQELNQSQAKSDALIKFKIYKFELNHNAITFMQLKKSIDETASSSQGYFDVVEVACKHIRRGAWEEFTKCGANHVIPLNLRLASIEFENQVNTSVRNIEISIAKWKRLYGNRRNTQLSEIEKEFNLTKLLILSMSENVIQAMEQFENIEDDLDRSKTREFVS